MITNVEAIEVDGQKRFVINGAVIIHYDDVDDDVEMVIDFDPKIITQEEAEELGRELFLLVIENAEQLISSQE